MPVTTYMTNEPEKHSDKELQELLDEMTEITGKRWFVVDYICNVSRRWFKKKVTTYPELLMQLDENGMEYQTFGCVNTIGEAKAFLIGAIGAYEKCKGK